LSNLYFLFAERITAHRTPLNMHYWRGFMCRNTFGKTLSKKKPASWGRCRL